VNQDVELSAVCLKSSAFDSKVGKILMLNSLYHNYRFFLYLTGVTLTLELDNNKGTLCGYLNDKN
jgi:hypothetical protein